MKKILIYECADGKRFDKIDDAQNYDTILSEVTQIMRPLGESVSDYEIKRHRSNTIVSALKDLMNVCRHIIPSYAESFDRCNMENIHGFAGRVLSDYSHDYPCLYKAYFRFRCISPTSFIEYDQPYWTTHEEEYVEYMRKLKGGKK